MKYPVFICDDDEKQIHEIMEIVGDSEEILSDQEKIKFQEYYMAENKSLHNGSEIWDTQLVTMYHYTDTMSNSKLLKILALCALTA